MKKVKIRKIQYLSSIKLGIIISIMRVIFSLYRIYPEFNGFVEIFGIDTLIKQYIFSILLFCVVAVLFTLIYNAFSKYFGGFTIYIEDE
ncbi:hypothetical protein [Maledivibacter halophilus]|uniref:Uncharacterized protein n=1 Tax=Maledivibacter halophilus TaxID=36842 RepID=A0A1T5KZ55_9FIRM|nr:hypothetical protein [Maledivibacter halophilus]SKC68991.1 hypothetical protein SAMN02194393_02197 [Maledivibacter halophilus]